jgi:NAD(P)-dependent dehydrogenase (short-subunit alcohol dehydrogenase family)
VGRGLGSVRGKLAVVTGAASGIGRATALLLAERGARLALCDLDAVGLEAAARELTGRSGALLSEAVDVTDGTALERFAARVEGELGVPDLLVNSAGVVVLGAFSETPLDAWDFVIDVNLKGTVRVCRTFLPAMRARGQGGQIVNVASAAAFATPRELAAYGATKHAVRGLSDALAEELAADRIGVSVVCPGFVATPILRRARIHGADPARDRRVAEAFLASRRLTAEDVARRIVWAAERGARLVPVGVEAHVLFALGRFAPARVSDFFGLVRRLKSRT